MHESVAEVSKARIRSDFVIGVSHDLRTPISSMKMLAESLYLGHIPDQGKQKQFLATIARECERLSQMIERVLFFVRYDQEALVYHMKQIEPGGLVESAVRTFEARYYGSEDRGQRTEVRGQRSEGRG